MKLDANRRRGWVDRLALFQINAIYSSPFERAFETAEPLAAAISTPHPEIGSAKWRSSMKAEPSLYSAMPTRSRSTDALSRHAGRSYSSDGNHPSFNQHRAAAQL